LLADIPIFFIFKLGDTKERLVIDYRGLNKIMIKDIYILLLASKLRDRIGKAKYFIKLDQYIGFNLIRIKEGDEWKTAFRSRYRYYEYLIILFGLTNILAIYIRLIYNLLKKYLDKYYIAYLDNILIFTETLEEYIKIVKEIL
jgi:hypothetical protein